MTTHLFLQKAFLTADILTCLSVKSTGVTININNGFIIFKCHNKS